MKTFKTSLLAGIAVLFTGTANEASAGLFDLFPMFSAPVVSVPSYSPSPPVYYGAGYSLQNAPFMTPWMPTVPSYPAYGYGGFPVWGPGSPPVYYHALPGMPGMFLPQNVVPIQNPAQPVFSVPEYTIPATEPGVVDFPPVSERSQSTGDRPLPGPNLESPFYP